MCVHVHEGKFYLFYRSCTVVVWICVKRSTFYIVSSVEWWKGCVIVFCGFGVVFGASLCSTLIKIVRRKVRAGAMIHTVPVDVPAQTCVVLRHCS
jgi:hypothetical protein